jgi:CheY-like chemotaxis protein
MRTRLCLCIVLGVALLAYLFVGVLMVTESNRVESANQTFCNQFGVTEPPSSLIGLTAEQLLERILPALADPTEGLARTQGDRGGEASHRGEEVIMLNKLNYRATSVASGEAAVEYLRHHAADLIVLDMIMDQGMDGLDTHTQILELHPHQKATIVSGFAETERVRKTQGLTAGAYVKKPYLLQKLGSAVKRELARSA